MERRWLKLPRRLIEILFLKPIIKFHTKEPEFSKECFKRKGIIKNKKMKIENFGHPKIIFKEKIFSVSEYLNFLNEIIIPQKAIIQGEIGEKINSYSRYSFFNLLDKQGGVLKCFVWQEIIDVLGMNIQPGMEIKVFGFPKIKTDRGELTFQVERIELVGEGILKKQFEILKKKLEMLGYFREELKKPIPKFCENIGLITSKVGRGALKDFKTHLGKFNFKIFFYEVKVEGSFAIDEIISAIKWFNLNMPNLDVIVLVRGGGDWESLQPFNSEEIVKAIFASKIPILTGIGHEDDITLADLAASLRASTPTHAAKILTENWQFAFKEIKKFEENFIVLFYRLLKENEEKIKIFKKNIFSNLNKKILERERNLLNLIEILNSHFKSYFKKFEILEVYFRRNILIIERLLKEKKNKNKDYQELIIKQKNNFLEKISKNIKSQEQKITIANPILKLKQGYSITYDEDGKIIKDLKKLKKLEKIKTKLYKGNIISKIDEVEY